MVEIIDLDSLATSTVITRTQDSHSAVLAIAASGYLAIIPVTPSLAISFKTLELFRCLRLQKASFSMEAFAKVICDYYAVPYRRRYRSALSDAFDIYLTMQHMIEKRVQSALGRDTPNWWVLNACPACCYSVGERKIGDVRTFNDSDYYLSQEFVDRFADEVDEGNAYDFEEDETSIFASACHHGLILWLVDMVQSGELAKYPLAMVVKVLELLGPCSMSGYDIGCTFISIIHESSLGADFRHLQCCIHNHACQTQNHPNVIEGMGIKDLEMMEHIFSSSNQLASIIRYASRYHRQMFIDMFFKQWDDDRYASLGNFLYNNYRQALDIINNDSATLTEALASLNIQCADLEKWQQEEAEYFATLGEEDEWDVHAVAYVQLLQELHKLDVHHANTTSHFLMITPTDYEFMPPPSRSSTNQIYDHELSQTRKLETQRCHLAEWHQQVLHEVIAMEVSMGISDRWVRMSPQYIETMCYIQTREYCCALDELQRLVVQHLFKLHNLNLAQTAYRVRTHMAKSLQTRCKVIRNVARPIVREAMKQAQRIARAREELDCLNVEVRRFHTAIHDENCTFEVVLLQLEYTGNPLYGAVDNFCLRRHHINVHLLAHIRQIYSLEGFTGTTPSTATEASNKPSLEDASLAHELEEVTLDDREGLDDLGEDNELAGDIGGIVDYVANLPLHALS
ncbi:hypothetical protein BKA93DRAFT_815632 [Sparassis latifolia]